MQPLHVDLGFLRPPRVAGDLGHLGPYRILKVLGRGGMGMVFLAMDERLQRQAALKVMLPDLARKPEAKERFLREARAAAAIEHDHIITIYQVDEDNGVPFMAMPLLQGCTLEDFLRPKNKQPAGPMRLPQILKIGRELAKGLAVAHQKGLVHRDIKPSNLWLDSSAGGRLKILDFGLVRGRDAEEKHLTQTGAVIGTPTHMSPEQARGEKVDFKTDLFSMGVVLYRLCTGELPFRGHDMMTTLMAVLMHLPPPPFQVNPLVPPNLSDLVMRLLAKVADDRPASAQVVVEELATLERELSRITQGQTLPSFPPATPPSLSTIALSNPATATSWRRWWPWLAGAGALLAVLLLFFLTRSTSGLGTLTILSDVGDVEVLVQGNGRTLKAKPGEHQLPPGEYTVALTDKASGSLSAPLVKVDARTPAMLTVAKGSTPPTPPARDDIPGLEGNRKVAEWLSGVEGHNFHVRTKDSEHIQVLATIPRTGDFDFVTMWLHNCSGLDDRGLNNLKPIRELTNLLLPPRITDEGLITLATIPGLKNLESLSLDKTRITDEGLRSLKEFKKIAYLYLAETAISDKGLAILEGLPNLENLVLSHTAISPSNLVVLRKLPRLKHLALGGLPITDQNLDIFLDFPLLTSLILESTRITDGGMKTLAQMAQLEVLNISRTKVTIKGLAELKKLPRLTFLNLNGLDLADDGLQTVKDLPWLYHLGLENTKITNKGIEVLKNFPRLSHLDLENTDIDDECINDLSSMRTLKSLFLTGTKISAAGFKKLKTVLSSTNISHQSSFSGGVPSFAKGKIIFRKEDELTALDPVDATSQFRAKSYLLKLEEGKEYQIDLSSTEFDPVLRVANHRGKQLAIDDDGAGYPNARLRFVAPATAQYFLIATSFKNEGVGRFSLQVQEK